MIRHILPSNPSMQFWRQVDSQLMAGAPVETASVCWLEVWMQVCVFWGEGLGVGICASCGFWAQADLQRGLCWQDHSWLCTSCRPCLTFFLDCRFSSQSWDTRAEAFEAGLKSWSMRLTDRRCTISSVDFRCCWRGSHTTDACSSTGCTRLCSNVSGYPFRFLHTKALTSLASVPVCWMCVPPVEVHCQLYTYSALVTLLRVWLWGGVAGEDPVSFLGHSQLVMFLYIKGH